MKTCPHPHSEKEPQDSRQQELQAFFEGKNSVCPFAYEAARDGKIKFEKWDPEAGDEGLVEPLMDFFKEHSAALLIAADADEDNHALALKKAYFMYRDVWLATEKIKPGLSLIAGAPDYVGHRLFDRLQDGQGLQSVKNQFEILGEKAFVFAMGPHYAKKHPRYAPHLCLIISWLKDTTQASNQHAVVESIRKKANAKFIESGGCPRKISPTELEVSEVDPEGEAKGQTPLAYREDFYVL